MRVDLGPHGLYVADGGTGTPLVLLHGFPLSSAIWEPVRRRLESVCRLVTPDLRGFGRSDAPEGDYSMAALADDVARALDVLGVERYVLGGHSMGGYVALRLAEMRPERLLGLLLVGSRASADPEEARARRMAAVLSIGATGPGPYIAAFVPGLVGETTRQARPELLEALHAICAPTAEHVLMGCQQGMAARPDSTAFVRSLDVPALVLAGEQDGLVSLEASDALAGSLRRGFLALVPGAGHTPSVEQPDATADAIVSFLGAIGLTGASLAPPREP